MWQTQAARRAKWRGAPGEFCLVIPFSIHCSVPGQASHKPLSAHSLHSGLRKVPPAHGDVRRCATNHNRPVPRPSENLPTTATFCQNRTPTWATKRLTGSRAAAQSTPRAATPTCQERRARANMTTVRGAPLRGHAAGGFHASFDRLAPRTGSGVRLRVAHVIEALANVRAEGRVSLALALEPLGGLEHDPFAAHRQSARHDGRAGGEILPRYGRHAVDHRLVSGPGGNRRRDLS